MRAEVRFIDEEEEARLESIRGTPIDPEGKTTRQIAEDLNDRILADTLHFIMNNDGTQKIKY
jgi:hypothetical protein